MQRIGYSYLTLLQLLISLGGTLLNDKLREKLILVVQKVKNEKSVNEKEYDNPSITYHAISRMFK